MGVRELNQILKTDYESAPPMEEILGKCQSRKHKTNLDDVKFLQVPLSEEYTKFKGFQHNIKVYNCTVISFGLQHL